VWRADRADEPVTWTAYRADDVGQELAPPVEHPDGSWRTEGVIARPGILVYREGGRDVRELVTADVLHEPEHIQQLRDVVVTLEHPTELVNTTNQERFNAGNISGEIRILSDGSIAGPIILRRADLLDAVRTRQKTELSEGYKAEIVNTPGNHPLFGPYDRIQVKRTPNHVAVTGRARGGRALALRLDATSSDIESMFVASVSQPTTGGAEGAAQESTVKTPGQLALEYIQRTAVALRLDSMNEEEAAAKAMEILRGAAGIDGRISKALGEAASIEDLRAQEASLKKMLAKVQGDLGMAEAEKTRLTQSNVAMKEELDSTKADMAKMVEPEVAVAQAMDGVMPPEGQPRLDSAKEQALRQRILGSVQRREAATTLARSLRLDAKTLGLDPATAPMSDLNRALADRLDSAYAKSASAEALDALVQLRARDAKNLQARLDSGDDSLDPGLLGLNFSGAKTEVRQDTDGGQDAGASFSFPALSLLVVDRPASTT
jgi:hypothetical protein